MNMKKYGAGLCAVLLSACMLMTGCGAPKADTQENIAEDEMPYGSTVTEDRSYGFTVSYDKRFLAPELVEKIAGYYRAIQEKDGTAFAALMFPCYHQYQMEQVYEGKVTDQALMDATYDTVKEYFGFDFAFSYIDITNFVSSEGQSEDYDAMYPMIAKLVEEQGEGKLSENMQALYELTVTRYVAEKGKNENSITEYVLKDEKLFAIQYQNQWYLMYL